MRLITITSSQSNLASTFFEGFSLKHLLRTLLTFSMADEKTYGTGWQDKKPLLAPGSEDKAVYVGERDEYSHLPDDEAEVLRVQSKSFESNAGYFSIFRFATSLERLLYVFAVIASIAEGSIRAVMPIIWGVMVRELTSYIAIYHNPYCLDQLYYNGNSYEHGYSLYHETSLYSAHSEFNKTRHNYGYSYDEFMGCAFNMTSGMPLNITSGYANLASSSYNSSKVMDSQLYFTTPESFQSTMNFFALMLMTLGIAEFILAYFFTFILIDRGDRVSGRVREEYLKSVLKQNIAYFDKLGTGEITTRISSDTMVIQEGISEKLGYMISFASTFTLAFVVALTQNTRLTGLILAITVVLFTCFYLVSSQMTKLFGKSLDGSSAGGTIVEEVLSSVRNVQAFGIQERIAVKYDEFLKISETYSSYAGFFAGAITGLSWLGLYLDDAMAFWQGGRFLREGTIQTNNIITINSAMIQGTFAVTAITPHVRAVSAAASAAKKIFSTIDRPSAIDANANTGKTLDKVEGRIELQGVKFIYPSRPGVTVMQDFNLTVEPGKTVALVGASGSGKSTIVGLIERFYNPIKGRVLLDGHDIESLNINWLRQQIALVSQEPTLFATTVYENVTYGLIGTPYEHASDIEKRELVVQACKFANAMDFIDNLPNGLETNVGERGLLLSGGQKQRIAIARAVVGDPKILLLDEATSALDTKSEGVVQEALDRAAKNRTTIVIAHRLSTIRDADNIVVIKKGHIIEQGTHDELIAKKGEYYQLSQAQSLSRERTHDIESSPEASDSDSIEKYLDEKAVIANTQSYDCDDENTEFEYSLSTEKLIKIITAKSISSLKAVEKSVVSIPRPTAREIFNFMVSYGRPEKSIVLLGLVFAFLQGVAYPTVTILYSTAINSFRFIPDYDAMTRFLFPFLIVFVGQGTIVLIVSILAVGILTTAGQKLLRRIRRDTLRQMLRQDISFFDASENTSGSLTSSIARDAQAIEGLTGATLALILSSSTMILGAIGIAFFVGWRMAFVVMFCLPLLFTVGFFRFFFLSKQVASVKGAHNNCASFACEAASSVKTVAALTREGAVIESYAKGLRKITSQSRKGNSLSAALYAAAQALVFLLMSLACWYGSTRVLYEGYSTFMFFTVFLAATNSSQSGSIMLSYALDMARSYQSAGNIKQLFDRNPEIDAWATDGADPGSTVEGNIEFKDVHFRYPTRLSVPVLRGISLSVKKGQYVALVGSSGCGKSTSIGLLERFYNPLAGQILLDGRDISELNLNAYRSNIALVQQEPTLYQGSIRENILYGSTTPEIVTDEQIYEACKKANIHDLILSLPDGYETSCGSKGTLFSGGQKQRIAIARALIRDPKILLLDEATSALDNESEKVVQAALDLASKGRTTIAIAHRLSTIRNADIIYVFEGGRILEFGNHRQLLQNKSKYYDLVKAQALEES